MFTLQRLALPPACAVREGLIDLLCDSVESGASVGFLSPLKRETADGFWQDMLCEVGSA